MRDLVFVVDDNQDAADMLAKLIRRLGYDARAIYSGREAIKQAAIHNPDMVLSDLKMPEVNGFNVADGIRRQAGGEHVILVAVTGLTGEVAKKQAYAAGFDLYLTKPATVDALRDVLDILHPLSVPEVALV